MGPSVVAAGFEVGLGVDAILGMFLVHCDDVRLPFGVGARDAEPNVGDGAGVVAGNSLPYRFYQHPSVALVVQSIGQFGLTFHLSEEEVGGSHHTELAHLLFVDQFDGGIAELFAD